LNPILKTLMASGNKVASRLYMRSNGRIGGSARGVPVLVLTVPGRKTGKPRSVPVAYFDHDGGYLVAATAGGSKTDPEWIRNLAASGRARVHVGEQESDVDARIVDGPERDQLWRDVVVERAPGFAKYDEKSGGRVIPIAILGPRS
jgi:deazaflavin-dependent oxidoreductase (nitroreductase family)